MDYIQLVCSGVVKRLILFCKKGLQGPHRYHSTVITNVKQAGRSDGTVSIRFCVATTWVWWGQKMEGNRIMTVSVILKLYCLEVYILTREYYKHAKSYHENSFGWKWKCLCLLWLSELCKRFIMLLCGKVSRVLWEYLHDLRCPWFTSLMGRFTLLKTFRWNLVIQLQKSMVYFTYGKIHTSKNL